MNNTIQVRVSDEMKAKIDSFAEANDMNTSEACRNLISMELNRKQTVFAASDFVRFLSSIGFNSLEEIEPKTLDDAARFYASYREGLKNEPEYWTALGRRELQLVNEIERHKRESAHTKGSYASRVRYMAQG